MTTRRYAFRPASQAAVRDETDPAAILVGPAIATIDVTWDESVADVSAVDAAMAQFSCVPAAGPDVPVAPGTIVLRAPGGSLWALSVGDAGVLSTTALP